LHFYITRTYLQTGGITLIQHFGSALNLNVHFHMLLLDGVTPQADMERIGFNTLERHYQVNLLRLRLLA